ncbi:MAG: N-acyl homoserine lactonase family protein [Acidimicrobiaceae bacterium]|nr:N-acyl homoserine lactonase family protein [Acidimicrobiaceae bacterium]
MPNHFVLQPLMVGRFPAFPIAKFLLQAETTQTIEAPCISWLARSTSTNSVVLVDTGPAALTEETSKFHTGLEVRQEDRIDIVLRSNGIDPNEITDVVFTHLHFDHCSHAQHLPNSRILVQKKEVQYAVAPNPEHRTGYEAGYRNVFPSWMKAFDKFEIIQGDVEVVPGCRILALPGHTPGSSAVIFETRQGRYAVAGDLVNQIENWEGNNGRHIAPTANCGLELCFDSFSRLEREADVVLASHDYRMFDSTKYGFTS